MKSTPRVTGDRPPIDIGYKYNYRKVLGFIATKVYGSTEPGDTYLSHFPDIYSNVSILTIVCNHFLGRYYNDCNSIDNHNRIQKSDLALDKYWVTQSGYFILATAVALGMGVTYGKLLFCHGISDGSVEKKISKREYNNSTVYDVFNNPIPYYCGSPYFNPPPITIDDRPHPDKRAHCTPDLIPSAISVASENIYYYFDHPF